jgi:hypothetical protein
MELEALFLSNSLNNDIVQHIYKFLYIEKGINHALRIAITKNHFLLEKILKMYKTIFDQSIHSSDYYLSWCENDMLGILNDNISISIMSPKLLVEHPNITTKYLLKRVSDTKLLERLFEIWCYMNEEKRYTMYINPIIY